MHQAAQESAYRLISNKIPPGSASPLHDRAIPSFHPSQGPSSDPHPLSAYSMRPNGAPTRVPSPLLQCAVADSLLHFENLQARIMGCPSGFTPPDGPRSLIPTHPLSVSAPPPHLPLPISRPLWPNFMRPCSDCNMQPAAILLVGSAQLSDADLRCHPLFFSLHSAIWLHNCPIEAKMESRDRERSPRGVCALGG